MKIAIFGYGFVAKGLLGLLTEASNVLAAYPNFDPRIVAITTRHGSLSNPNGLKLEPTLALTEPALTAPEAMALADVVVELTPTNVQTGGAGLENIRQAFALGKHVVTANKGPLVVAYHELAAQAKAKSLQFRFEGTVMGGTPAMVLGLEVLSLAGVKAVRGIVNGTTNYILTQMEAGGSYADALRKAQELGYAEADPAGDVEGWDAAAKVVILANTLMGGQLGIADVAREGITGITAEMVAQAAAVGERWKLVGQVVREGEILKASVQPTRLPLTDPLAQVGGGTNALTYSTEAIGDVTLIGGGAGGKGTGFAVLMDLVKIHLATGC